MLDFKRNINRVYKNREPFWGKYVELNNVEVPSLDAIQQYQLSKIQMFQQQATQRAANKYANINALFKSGAINSLPSEYSQDENQTLDKVITKLVTLLNSTYSGKNKDGSFNYERLNNQLSALRQAIESTNSALIGAGADGIPSQYLDRIDEAISACGMGYLSKEALSIWFKQLNLFKGNLVEDLGVEWLKAQKIPNITTLNTGSLNLQGEVSQGRHRGQLIQDLMMLDISIPNIGNIPITYKPAGSDAYINSTISQLLADMDSASGGSKQIIITDEGYDTLLSLSALNIQAKAGLNQKPWNENKNTSVSISEFDASDGLAVSAYKTFELLHELDQDVHNANEDWVKTSSNDYNMLADYGLASCLFKILHLEEQGNQYLLTPDGFVTYTERMAKLMENRKSRVHIKGRVTVDSNTLNNQYTVGMTNIN